MAQYDATETKFLVEGFRDGFSIGYTGPAIRQNTSNNIPFQPGAGNLLDMWNKIMKEVKEERSAGPFQTIPYPNYIQSPIGLVLKAGGKTRLIFHLSFDFLDGSMSLNYHTPKEICTLKYNDLDAAVLSCLMTSQKKGDAASATPVFMAKSDLMSAFRMLPISPRQYCWLVMKCRHPRTRQFMFFVDKCLPFGASISCAHFQRFSNALKHLVEFLAGRKMIVTNYLDDFLFVEATRWSYNHLVRIFLVICQTINLPVSHEKTEWAAQQIIFLGVLLDGARLTLSVPMEKGEKALKLLRNFGDKKKATVKELQVLTGYLNFLAKAIFPGRAFTRRMYAKYSRYLGKGAKSKLKHYHHVRLDKEFKFNCQVWTMFLSGQMTNVVCRPIVDLNTVLLANQLNFYSDASASPNLGFGAIFDNQWLFSQWEPGYIDTYHPTIEYLELYALCAAILTLGWQLKNSRIIVFCDNIAVVHMINKATSSCKNCMNLIRLLTLSGLIDNRRVFARHVHGVNNELADSLSRLQFDRFWNLAPPSMSPNPSSINSQVWPASKIWLH